MFDVTARLTYKNVPTWHRDICWSASPGRGAQASSTEASEDGFNWRKYGQKNVKGNEYVRSYYKCSYPNSCVKKQIERSHDGRITDVAYLGNYEHAKPHAEPKVVVPSQMSIVPFQLLECQASAVDEDKPSDKHSPGTDDVRPMNVETVIVAVPDGPMSISVPPLNQRKDEHSESLTPKRRKKAADSADITPEKPDQESRLVIQTVSEVDIMSDGYRWRRYGQKMVKGNPNPSSCLMPQRHTVEQIDELRNIWAEFTLNFKPKSNGG